MKKIFSILFIVPYLMFSQDSLSLSKAIENGLQKNYDIRLTLKNVEINKILARLAMYLFIVAAPKFKKP